MEELLPGAEQPQQNKADFTQRQVTCSLQCCSTTLGLNVEVALSLELPCV